MCGIAGILNTAEPAALREQRLRQMLAGIRHRGPDEAGIYMAPTVALGSVRLSILDIQGGQQPITNEDGSIWVVYNGEVFNFWSLREALLRKGHQFMTRTDTEVLVHLYEEHGPDFLSLLNGQYAFALWDGRRQALLLARDRFGIRPLYLCDTGHGFLFASEIKALLASGLVETAIDPLGIDQAFSFWSTLSPRTSFTQIVELPPGHLCWIEDNCLAPARPYWRISFPDAAATAGSVSPALEERLADQLAELLVDATRLRLRADVPVGAYLSGGLDSSITTAIIRHCDDVHLDTFSIAFDDVDYDEGVHQNRMAGYLGTDHHIIRVTHADVGRVFPEVVWHAEMPLLRTSPAPMYMLSQLVHERDYKVVLTGEGADEILGGYNIFKEDKVRRFWARQPDSTLRPRLLSRLYPYVVELGTTGEANLIDFFKYGLTATDERAYSHAIRWRNTARAKRFFSNEMRREVATSYARDAAASVLDYVTYPAEFESWGPLNQAQYLELSIFMAQYLLSAQGDRMAMAHSVEGRYPFLDHRLAEFCSTLPASVKLRGLKEKLLLRKAARRWLPDEIAERPKQAYRAPIHRSFSGAARPDYLADLLSPAGLADAGLFEPSAVEQLVGKVERGRHVSETDDMALAGIISCQLLHRLFIRDYRPPAPLAHVDKVVYETVGVPALSE
jgi:asparagine synthase (glutamine-hydrolysing)